MAESLPPKDARFVPAAKQHSPTSMRLSQRGKWLVAAVLFSLCAWALIALGVWKFF